nr:unnamed protein product [Callosobruchus analis]
MDDERFIGINKKAGFSKKTSAKRKNNIQLKQSFKSYRNCVSNLIKITKNNYYLNKLNENANNYRKTWETINEISNKPKNSTVDKIKVDNDIPTEVEEIISTLKSSASSGIELINTRVIKLVKLYISLPLAHIINLIFTTSTVPLQFKDSYVVPIYKAGNKEEMTNYRPITIINSFAKIFEKCLNKGLWSFLNKYSKKIVCTLKSTTNSNRIICLCLHRDVKFNLINIVKDIDVLLKHLILIRL